MELLTLVFFTVLQLPMMLAFILVEALLQLIVIILIWFAAGVVHTSNGIERLNELVTSLHRKAGAKNYQRVKKFLTKKN